MEDEVGGISLAEAMEGIESLAELFKKLAESVSEVIEDFKKMFEAATMRDDFALEWEREAWKETVYIMPPLPLPRPERRKAFRWRAAVFGYYISRRGKSEKEGGEHLERRIRYSQKAA